MRLNEDKKTVACVDVLAPGVNFFVYNLKAIYLYF